LLLCAIPFNQVARCFLFTSTSEVLASLVPWGRYIRV